MPKKEIAGSPPAVDPRTYRNVIGTFATGVTVVATGEGDQFHGMTANAVTSLSLDPLLVLVCVGKKARMAQHLPRQKGFSINILRYDQMDLSTYFAGGWKADKPPKFEFVSWHGAPLLKDCAAAVGCELYQTVEGGDHWIFIGKVIDVYQNPGHFTPLLFYQGRYRQLAHIGKTDEEILQESAFWVFPW